MSYVSIQNSLNAGELSPSLYGRTDLEKYHAGTSTCRNFFANYRGGIISRGGLAYVGMCKQPGTGAAPRDIPFQFSLFQNYVLEFGDQYMRIKYHGAYVTEATKTVTSVNSSGVFSVTAHGYSVGDWVYNIGNTGFNGLTWIVHTVTTNSFTVTDLFGNVISSATASTSGTVARVYTVVAPYAAVDLPYLKFTQSADTMTLTCVNTSSNFEYIPYNLVRVANTNWTFTAITNNAEISPPTNVVVTAQSSTTTDTWYAYVVTAVNGATSEESVASAVVQIENNDISINAGSNTITWNPVSGATSYNVYTATSSYSQAVPAGVLFGFLGTALGLSFVDNNIVADFTKVPPVHRSPFSRGQILQVNITASGTGYTQATVGFTITTSTGTLFAGSPLVNGSGGVEGFYIQNNGEGYSNTDTITITDSGAGASATATLTFGPQSGTWPSEVAYFQQRLIFASTLNRPDTYWMSQPGLYNNFDYSIPISDSDAITGTPWAQQINGIQFLVPMPGGLVVLTGKGAWQVTGGSQAAITPSDQTAIPQAYNGCHNNIPPIPINYDILYVQSKGSIVRDLSYNFFVNIYTGTDMTVLSNHLFNTYQITQWAYCEEPYKLVWVVRSDGTLLCLTYLKEQDVYSWTRHDTDGLFQGVCSVTEFPVINNVSSAAGVDAPYFIVQRYVQGGWRYYSERMDNRTWANVQDSFCVDSGLAYPMTYPNATLSASAATGNITLTASSGVFTSGNVGDVIRMGGGTINVTGYTSSTVLSGTVILPITQTLFNNPNNMPVPQQSGNWTISTPTSTVSGLNHLNGLTVAILADGSVVQNQVVTNNSVLLPQPASQIVVGLPYVCQAQTLYLDHPGENTVQNRRKNISAVGLRVEATRGLQIGADQPDQAAQQNNATLPWTNMVELKQRTSNDFAGQAIALYTGDFYQSITSKWDLKGQLAVQQLYPLPASILSVICYWAPGDEK